MILTRVYLRGGQVAHLMDESRSPNADLDDALCGVTPGLGAAWLGTGTQGEHERADSMRLCLRCEVQAQ